jgi:chromosomal replication initiation ATPase DnaA
MMDQRIDPALCRADRLIEEACLHLAVSHEALVGPRRNREIAAARQLVCYVLHRAGYSASQIGLRLGRNHSYVVQALRRVEQTPILVEQAAELSRSFCRSLVRTGNQCPAWRRLSHERCYGRSWG